MSDNEEAKHTDPEHSDEEGQNEEDSNALDMEETTQDEANKSKDDEIGGADDSSLKAEIIEGGQSTEIIGMDTEEDRKDTENLSEENNKDDSNQSEKDADDNEEEDDVNLDKAMERESQEKNEEETEEVGEEDGEEDKEVENKTDYMDEGDDEEDWNEVIKLFEKDSGGYVETSQLGNILRYTGLFPTDEEVDEFAQEVDEDGTGQVTVEDLVKHIENKVELHRETPHEDNFKDAFLVFDKDGNGKISSSELTKVLTEMGRMKMSVEEAEEFIAMVDKDGDSMLDYSEFVVLFTEKIS